MRIMILSLMVMLINVSYASFPVHHRLFLDTTQTDEMMYHHYNLQKMGLDLSSCKCMSCRNGNEAFAKMPEPLTKKSQEVKAKRLRKSGGLFIFLSVIALITSLIFGLLSLGNGFSHSGSDSLVFPFFLLSVFSLIGSVIFAVNARKNGVSWFIAILALSLSLVVGLFFFPLFFV